MGQLGALYRAILAELRRRGVIRTGNAPVGDYAEWLVHQALGGELAPNSQPSWDVKTQAGELIQVKSRFVTDPQNRGERQLSPFRSWEFDAAVIVLFDDEFQIWRATSVPVDVVKEEAHFVEHVNGHPVHATDQLLTKGDDLTQRLTDVAQRA